MADRNQRTRMMDALRGLLAQALELRNRGSAHAETMRAFGKVDGYLQAMADAGAATERELAGLVTTLRAELDGAATRRVEAPESIAATARVGAPRSRAA